MLEDIAYSITASLHNNKPRNEDELFKLYSDNGGLDNLNDFQIKWNIANFELGNVRELREFKSKLLRLKK